jgi:flagellar hook-associated protein 2
MVTRLNGFSNTGIDIDATVKQLMTAARIPFDQLGQKKQTLTWQRDEYRAANANFLDLRNTLGNMKLQSSYLARKATSADESAVSAVATANANPGINTITIDKLASSASLTSDALGAADDTKKLSEIGIGFALGDTTTLTVGGDKGSTTIELSGANTIAELVNAVNGKSSITGVKLSYDSNMDRLFFTSSITGDSSKINLRMQGTNGLGQNLLKDVLKLPVTGTTPSVTLNDIGQTVAGSKMLVSTDYVDSALKTDQNLRISVAGVDYDFTINNKTTNSKLIDNINNSALGKTGVSAYLNSAGQLSFFNPDDSNTLSFTDTTADSSDILAGLGLDVGVTTNADLDYSEVSSLGANSEIVYNGVTTGFASNTFSINGISFNAKKTTTQINISVTQDTDTMFNSIKAFVDKYNTLITTTNDKLSEEKYRDFTPLTPDQRTAMKEDDIKAWELKAKSGQIRNDSMISSGLQNLRSGLSASVSGLASGSANSLSEIGIGTTLVSGKSISGSYLEPGKLYIDEAKLRKALDENPEDVMNLFLAKDGDTTSDSGDGIAVRMFDRVTSLMDKITKKAGATGSLDNNYTIGKSFIDLTTKMSNLTTKLDALETRYYSQFTAMEKYINQMNAQSAQLTSAFQ